MYNVSFYNIADCALHADTPALCTHSYFCKVVYHRSCEYYITIPAHFICMIYGSGRSRSWCAATPSSLHSTQCISPQGDSRGWISIQQSVRNPLVCFPQHASTSGEWQPTLVLTCCVQQTPDHQQSSMICLSWQNVRVTVLSCEVMFISVSDSDAM